MTTELIWSLLIKGSLFVGIAALAALALRRSSAARRHPVWLIALGASLLIPAAEIKLPSWSVSPERTPVVAALVVPQALRVVKPVAAPASVATASVQPASAAQESHRIPLETIWWVGFLACAAWIAFGLTRAALLVRSGTPWQPDSPRVVEALSRARILLVPHRQIPATAGVFRPVVLLPEEAKEWDEDRLMMVLSHEMAHVHRRDWLWLLVSQAACALNFFNPLVWLAARQMRKESEFACDDFVLSRGVEPTSYAQELLEIARRSRLQTIGTCGMARNKNVESRLRSIVDAGRRRNRISGQAMIALLAGSFAIVVPIAVLRAVSGPQIALQASAKLPKIEWVESRQVEPNVYLAQDGVAGLPGGISVRLVGVTTPEGDMWDLAKNPVAEEDKWREGGIYWQGNSFHRWSHGFTGDFAAFSRKFIVEVQSAKAIKTGFTSLITEPTRTTELQRLNPVYAGADDHIPDVDFKANDPSYSLIELSVPSRSTTGVYRVGIADPNWTTVAEIDNPYHGGPEGIGKERNAPGQDSSGIHLGVEPVVYYADKSGTYHQTNIGSTKLTPDVARRVRLYDKDGKLLDLPENLTSDTNGYMLAMLRADFFCRISKIVLQTSPYMWAEFRDVPLRPDFAAEKAKRLSSNVRGTATGIAPGYTHLLRNGVTVSVEAVTRATLDGKNWTFLGQPSWRADGKVLAKPPKIAEWPMEAKVWGKTPLLSFKLRYDNLPREANTVIHAAGQIDKTFWLYGMYDSSRSSIDALFTSYLPEAKTGDLEVGVATGPWKTIARQPIDVAEQPEKTGKSTGFAETGVAFFLGDDATYVGEDKKTVRMTIQSLKGVSKRLVAILKTGETKVLTVATSGMKGVEGFYLPARHGESTETYNQLIASQVKEVQLQVRPYEWTKFTGIALNHN